MLSAALRGAPPHSLSQPSVLAPSRLPPVLPAASARVALASSCSSVCAMDDLGPIFESPRPLAVPIPTPGSARPPEEEDCSSSSSEETDDLLDGVYTEPSASSFQTQHTHMSFQHAAGAISAAGTPGGATLHSAGPSFDFTLGQNYTIGRAAMSIRGSGGDLQAELEHLSSCAPRGSRPIAIHRPPGIAATYHPAAGAFMPGFVPPHELAAASMQDSDPMAIHSHRHKSTAERLRAAVFEQTGLVSANANAFLVPSRH